MTKRFKLIMSGLLCLLMVGLAGCQVAGSKIDDVLDNAVNMKSYEGSGSLSLEFANAGTAAPLKLGELELASLGKVDITITSMKQAEPNNLSLTGSVAIMNRSIPFFMELTKAQLAILIDNNPKPVIFKLDTMIGNSINLSGIPISAIFSNPDKLLTLISPFIISKLPDVTNAGVSAVKETINEESLDLQKIHMELNSKEAIAFVKGLISNIAKDPAGIKALVGEIYNAFFVSKEVEEGEFDISSIIIDGAATMLIEQLPKLSASLDETASKPDAMAGLLNNQTSLKADLYLDGSAQLRKVGLDINLGGTIKAMGSFSFWKVNQAVTPAPSIAIPADAFQWEGTSIMAHLLKSMNSSSEAYQLLMNDLKVLNREIKLVLPVANKNGAVPTGTAFLSKEGRTMVPVRYIAETLDSEVTWDAVKKQATIVDIMTGKTIIITLGSKNASVDGNVVPMDNPATAAVLVNSSTYVPLSFISNALTGEAATWDQKTRTVSISKK